MADQDLYKQNAAAAKENRDIFKQTPDQQMASLKTPEESYNKFNPDYALPLTPENRSPYDYTGEYSKYIQNVGSMSANTDIDRLRAEGQSGWEQAFNVGKRAVIDIPLGVVSNLASMLDVEDYVNMDDEIGNPIQRWADGLMEQVKSAAPIYRESPGSSFDVTDSGYIWDNVSMLLDSAGAFAFTGMITGGILGAATKGLQSSSLAAGLEAKYGAKAAQMLSKGELTAAEFPAYVQRMTDARLSIMPIVVNAAALNQAESIMEATGVYKDVVRQKLDEGHSLAEAKVMAGEAATLDVDINRANFFLNLTSAGLFTKGAKAIKAAAGGLGKTVMAEGAQEAAEEGVNYIAQMEAMQQAKDGPNYQWDTKRALSNLGTAQGAEAMVLGAIGGAANTVLTEGVMHGRRVKEDLIASKNRLLAQSGVKKMQDNITNLESEIKKHNEFFTAAAENIDEDAFTRALTSLDADASTAKGKQPSTRQLDLDIQSFNIILANPTSTTDQKARAQKAIDAAETVKKMALDPSHSNIWGTKNAPAVVMLKMNLDAMENERQQLNKTRTTIDTNTLLDEEGKKAALKPIDEQLNALNTQMQPLLNNYNTLLKESSKAKPAAPKVDPANATANNAAENKKAKATQARTKTKVEQEVKSTTTPPNIIPIPKQGKVLRTGNAFNIETWTGNSDRLEDVAPVIHRHKERADGKKYSQEASGFEIGYDEANDIVGEDLSANEDKTSALVFDSTGTAYAIRDNKVEVSGQKEDYAPGETSKLEYRPIEPKIYKLQNLKAEYLKGADAVKYFLAQEAVDTGQNKNIIVGDSKFTRGDLEDFISNNVDTDIDFAKTREVKAAIESIPQDAIVSFLRQNLEIKEYTDNGFKETVLLDDVQEPSMQLDDSIIQASYTSVNTVTSTINSIGFLSVPWVKNEITGRYENAGEANEEYIANSIPGNVLPGDTIILEAYDGKPVPMTQYDVDGNAITIKNANGKIQNITEEHNTSSLLAAGKTDIPIAIYATEKTSRGKSIKTKKGRLLGYLKNDNYLNEKKNGKYVHFVYTDESNALAEIGNIQSIRAKIVEMYKKDPSSASLTSEIKRVSPGTLQKGLTENNISDIGGSDPHFGYILGGIAVDSNGNTINVSNNIERVDNGTPVIFGPMADGSLFAIPCFSKTNGVMNTANGTYAEMAVNGIVSHILKENTSVEYFQDLKDYLSQYIFISSPSHIENSKNKSSYLMVTEDSIEWRNGSQGERIPFSVLRGLKGNKESLRSKLEPLRKYIATQKVNYNKSLLSSNIPVWGVKADGQSTIVANNGQEFYKGTLATPTKPLAMLPNGEPVWAVSPVISFDTEFINKSKRKAIVQAVSAPKPVAVNIKDVAPSGKVVVASTQDFGDSQDASLDNIILSDDLINPVVDDSGIFGFPAAEKADLLGEFIKDELENPEIVSTSDGQIITSEEKAAGVQVIVLSVDKALSGKNSVNIGEALTDAKKSIFALSKLYESRALAADQSTEAGLKSVLTYNSWIESLNRVRDPKAWRGIENAAVNYLAVNGVDIRSKNASDISEVADGEVNSDDSIDGYRSEDGDNGWNITDSFYKDPRSYSTIRTKSMMASLVDTTKSVLGMAPLFDQGEAYRKIMRIVSMSTKRGYKDIMQSIKDESDKISMVIPNNIYKQLLDKLNKATVQEKIQFKVATNMQRNIFLMTLFDPKNPGGTKVINAQARDAHKLILNEWQSRFRYLLSSARKPKEYLSGITDKFSIVRDELKLIKDENKRRARLATYAKDLFAGLGISLELESWAQLTKGDKTLYNKGNGYDLGRKDFVSQLEEQGLFSVLEKTIAGLSEDASIDDSIEILNQGIIKFLSTIESQNNKRYFPDRFRGLDDKSRYNYSLMTPTANAINRLKSDKSEVDRLKATIYSGHSFLLDSRHFGEKNTTDFSDSFQTVLLHAIKDTTRKRQKENKDMHDADSIFSRLQLFANATKHGVNDEAIVVGHTHSDKTLNLSIQSKRSTIHPSLFDVNGNLTAQGRESMINGKHTILAKAMSIVYGEAERMIAMSTASKEKLAKLKKEYGNHVVENGQFFYGLAFLNQYLTFDKNLKLTNDENGLGKLDMSNPANERFWKEKVLDYFIEETEKDEKYWESIGLITKDQFGQYNVTPVPDGYAKSKGLYGKVTKKYVKNGQETSSKFNGITNPRKAIKMLSLEANMNTSAIQSAFSMITSGDIANTSKNTKEEILKLVKSGKEFNRAMLEGIDVIFAEHLGRLAADVAPAQSVEEEYEFTDKNGNTVKGGKTYNILIAKDYLKSGEEYAKSVSELVKGSVPKNFKATDGLEFVTVYHKLDSLFRSGKINEEDFVRIRDKYKKDGIITEDDLKYFVIGAGKPRQVYEKTFVAGADTFIKRIYIKSSEIPLIKQVTESMNSEIDGLRKAMEDNGIDRLVHASAVKLGEGIPVDVYTENGGIIDSKKLAKSMKDNVISMDWSGFGYQLELPEKIGDPKVTRVSQADANILEGTDEMEFDLSGKKFTGRELKRIKHSINRNLSGIAEAEVDRELDVDSSGLISPTKVYRSLDKNRSSSGLSENDVSSVYYSVKEGLPLIFSNIPRQVESSVFSKYNSAIKMKAPGTMLPQYPWMGKTEMKEGTVQNISSISGLIKTRSFDPSRGLSMTRVVHDSNGVPVETIIAECTLPWKIWGRDGLIDLESLTEKEGEFTGFIDPAKLPDSLLRIVGMRTPNEGHSTQIMLKVVAFTPKIHGDLMYIPTEITVQMGSDYDIDKMTSYWRNMIQANNGSIITTPKDALLINRKNGDVTIDIDRVKKWINKHFNISSISDENVIKLQVELNDAIIDGSILTSPGIEEFIEAEDSRERKKLLYELIESRDESVMQSINKLGKEIYLGPSISSVVKKVYEDAYFDIFDAVLSHPEIASKSMSPLDSDDLRDQAKVEPESSEIMPWFSLRRQSMEYVRRQSTKDGINIFAKENSSINGAENNSMRLLDADGNVISFNKFGGITLDTLDASGKSSYKGAPRTGKKNIAIQLSGALDDRKHNALAPNGLLNKTFGISGAISSLTNANKEGLNLEYNTLFLKQRAIRRVVRMMNLGSSVMASYELSQNKYFNNAVEAVREKYLSMLDAEGRDRVLQKLDSLKDVSYNTDDLLSLLKQSKEDNTSEEYIARQLDMLNILEKLKGVNDAMFELTSQTTADSQGFRSTYAENIKAIDSASKIGKSRSVSNSSLYLSNDGTAKLEDGRMMMDSEDDRLTTTGNNLRLVSEKTNLVKKLMGYDSPFVSNAISAISNYTRTRDLSDVFEYAKAAKAFIYAQLPMFEGYNISELTNGSLVDEMMYLKGLPEMANNMYIRSLEASKGMKYISIAAVPGDSIAARKIRDGFRDLLLSKDEKIKSFADKMIAYEFLAGGSQHASNSIKYIPNSYLNRMGLYKQIADKLADLNNNPATSEQLLKLYLQNNPEDIRFSRQGNASYNKSTGSIVIHIDDVAKDSMKEPLKFIKIKGDHYMQLNVAKSAITREANGTLVYENLPLRGGLVDPKNINRLVNDYSSNGITITPQNVVTSNSPNEASQSEVDSKNEFISGIRDIFDAPMQLGADSLIDLVGTIDTPYSAWMVGAMRAMQSDLANVAVMPMALNYRNYNQAFGAGSYNYDNNILSLSTTQLENIFKSTKSSQFIKEIVLHEIAHAMQVIAYRKGKNGDAKYTKIYNDVNTLFADAIKQTKKLNVLSAVTGQPLIGINGTQLTYGMFTSGEGLRYENKKGVFHTVEDIAKQVFPDVYGRDNSDKRNELKFALYMFSKPEEFIAEVSSKKHVQDFMGAISMSDEAASAIGAQNNKSILRAFLDRMAKFFSGLTEVFLTDNKGLKLAQNSILEGVFVQNTLMFASKKNIDLSIEEDVLQHPSVESQQLPGTVREYLQNADKTTRAGFRYALNNGLVKTKC